MTGPDEGALAGRGHQRAAHADREHVIEVLKVAFVQGRLDKDELDTRVGQAYAARTYADLSALTADIPVGPADAGPLRLPVGPADAGPPLIPARPSSTPARTLAKAALRSWMCLVLAVAMAWVSIVTHGAFLAPFLTIGAAIAATGFLGYGIVDACQEWRSRRQLPSRPSHGGQEPERGPTETGHDPAPPGALANRTGTDRTRADRTGTDLRTRRPGPGLRHAPRRGIPMPRGIAPVPGVAYGASSAP